MFHRAQVTGLYNQLTLCIMDGIAIGALGVANIFKQIALAMTGLYENEIDLNIKKPNQL